MVHDLARERGLTVVWVLHDLNEAAAWSERWVLLAGGRVAAAGRPAEVVTAATVQRVFGLDAHILAHPESGRPLCVPRHGRVAEAVASPADAAGWGRRSRRMGRAGQGLDQSVSHAHRRNESAKRPRLAWHAMGVASAHRGQAGPSGVARERAVGFAVGRRGEDQADVAGRGLQGSDLACAIAVFAGGCIPAVAQAQPLQHLRHHAVVREQADAAAARDELPEHDRRPL